MSITVPMSDMWVQSVMPQGQLAYQDIHSSSGDFGAQVGEAEKNLGGAIQQTGNTLAKHAAQRKALIDKARAEDLFSTQYMPAMTEVTNQFYSLKGQDAEDNYRDYAQKLIDLQREYSSQLTGPVAQNEFDTMSKSWNGREVERMSRHAAEQSKAWQLQANDSLLDSFVLDGQNHYNDPKSLQQNRNNIIHHAEFFGATHGIDFPTTETRWRSALDKMYSGAVRNQAQSDPIAAQTLYDRYSPYMSSDEVRQHVLDNLLPSVRQEQNAAVYKDVLNRFDLTGPNSDSSNINDAIDWIRDPENYKDQLFDPDQRDDMAKMIQGSWNRARQFHTDNQSAADSNFTDAVAGREIAGLRLLTWRDPKTGLPPSSDIVQAAMEHDANLVEPSVSNTDTLISLANDISNRRMSDRGPVNQAYLDNLITDRDYRDLADLSDAYLDPAKSRWFDYARGAFYFRFRDSSDPNGVNSEAMKLFPAYLMGLNGAVRDEDLKGSEIRDLANKMLDDLGKMIPAGADLPVAGASPPVESGAGIAGNESQNRDTAQPAAQNANPGDSWFWQTLESSDTLKPYVPKMREYVASPTDTKGAWDWLTHTIPKSPVQTGVDLAKAPFDLAQTFSGELSRKLKSICRNTPILRKMVREDPVGENLQTIAAIGMSAGIPKVAEATAKGIAAAIGKAIGVDAEKQTWSWDNFKDAWVNHPVESFAAVYPFGASSLKSKGIMPSEIEVRELVIRRLRVRKRHLVKSSKRNWRRGHRKGNLTFLKIRWMFQRVERPWDRRQPMITALRFSQHILSSKS